MSQSSTAQRARPKRLSGELLSITVVDAEPGGVRFSTPRKIGTAVARNRLRRQLREVIRRAPPPRGLLVTVGATQTDMTFQKLEDEYLRLIAELGIVHG